MTKLEKISAKELEKKTEAAFELVSPCRLCPRKCKIERAKGEKGYCKAGMLPMVASYHAHFGEEPPISGNKGSGTIFFSNCSLRCVFCQNYSLSQMSEGKEISTEELAGIMLELQGMGCHNINFVTPDHYLVQIFAALIIAKEKGLHVPLVYNCSGYESPEALKILDGIIDIYMPDFKWASASVGWNFSGVKDYPEIANRLQLPPVGDSRAAFLFSKPGETENLRNAFEKSQEGFKTRQQQQPEPDESEGSFRPGRVPDFRYLMHGYLVNCCLTVRMTDVPGAGRAGF